MNYRQNKKLSKKASKLLPEFLWEFDEYLGITYFTIDNILSGDSYKVEAYEYLEQLANTYYNPVEFCHGSGDFIPPVEVVQLTPQLVFSYGRDCLNK